MPETFSYTGTKLATEVKNQFGDTGSVQINDALILNWINNGLREVTKSNPWLEKVFTTGLIADQAIYDLNVLMSTARVQNFSAVVVQDRKIDVIPWAEYQSKIASQVLPEGADRTPQLASEYGGMLTLWPSPGQTVVDGIVIYYTAWPADLATLGDTLTVPDRFYNALSAYVFAKALELDENFEASQVVMEQHDKALAAEFQRDKMDPTDYYPSIVYDDGGGW